MNEKLDAISDASSAASGHKSEATKSPWPGPKGMIPVTSGQAEDANVHNRAYLDNILVEMRVIDAVKPDLTTEIFGHKFSSPLTLAAISHLDKIYQDSGRSPMHEKTMAAKRANILNWIGMESDQDYERITREAGPSVRVVKPFADHDRIIDELQFAQKLGAVAVGIDIDHVPGTDGNYDVVDGIKLGPITQEDLAKYVASVDIPFVAKGVLSVFDALKAKKAGVSAIVVSHHHGRLPFGVPPLQVLPEIIEALAGSGIKIFVDGSLMSGYDAYKALAMGADAVLIGRGILSELLDSGENAVIEKIEQMNQELSELMMYTNVKDTKSFDSSVLHIQG